jgi:hypothetical protein
MIERMNLTTVNVTRYPQCKNNTVIKFFKKENNTVNISNSIVTLK